MSRRRFVASGGVIRETGKVPQSHTEFTVDIGLTTAMDTGKRAVLGGTAQGSVQGRAGVRGQLCAGSGAGLVARRGAVRPGARGGTAKRVCSFALAEPSARATTAPGARAGAPQRTDRPTGRPKRRAPRAPGRPAPTSRYPAAETASSRPGATTGRAKRSSRD